MTMFEGLPSSLRIGPFDVKVIILDQLDGDDDWGEYLHGSLIIHIVSPQPTPSHAADTVVHEINHALWRISNLRDSDDEERIVSALATGWTQVYRDNPKLIQWIASACQ